MTAVRAEDGRWRLGALGWAISAEDFTRWLAQAPVGARLDYAGGPEMPHHFPVVAAVRAAVEAGAVLSHNERCGRGWCFFVVRRDGAAGASAAVWPEPGSVAARLLGLLVRTAGRHHPCPTNAVLALALDLRNADAARYLMRQLADAGLISIENRGPLERRIVTIIGSNMRTAPGRLGARGEAA